MLDIIFLRRKRKGKKKREKKAFEEKTLIPRGFVAFVLYDVVCMIEKVRNG
jgi:hypothetical protein